MANLTDKKIKAVLNDFKESLYISVSLEKLSVNHFDFFEDLEEKQEFKALYEKILNYNNLILEDRIAKKAYEGEATPKILMEMLKANNKKKYNVPIIVESNVQFNNLSDDDLDDLINEIQNDLTK